ncbi:PXA domain-containing protein [Dipodascopsis uninucleata]
MSQKRLSIPTVVAGVSIILGCILFIRDNYSVRLAVESFLLGTFVCAILALAAVGYFYKHTSPVSGGNVEEFRKVRFPAYAFAVPGEWDKEMKSLSEDKVAARPLYPPSFVISGSLDLLIEYILRDFILSWYSHISVDASFPAQVENTIRVAVEQMRDRLLKIDMVVFTMKKIIPILTKHVSDFAAAETALHGKNLNKHFTESRELDIALASKYADGELHPAASLKAPDPRIAEKQWIRKLIGSILPYILPETESQSRAVFILVQEIVSYSVIMPIISALEDPDTWNQLIQRYASSTLQDRKAVQRLRAVLDKHASPINSKTGPPVVRLTAKSDERTYEKFVRGIRRCTLLSEARRLRYDITIQLKRAMKDGNDNLYIRRLKNARRLIDAKIADLTNESKSPTSKKKGTSISTSNNHDPREDYNVQQLLQSAAGLSYFMEYMDRHKRTVLLQFWLVVDGFKNPLENDDDDSDDDPNSITWSTSETWSSADKEDISQIYISYFNEPLLNIPQKLKSDVTRFLDSPISTPNDYKTARRAILKAQRQVYDVLQEEDLARFKSSDIFLKYLTSTDPESESQITKGTVDDYHVGLLDDPNDIDVGTLNVEPDYIAADRKSVEMDSDGLSISVQPEDDVVQAVQAAFDDIMQSQPGGDDTSSNISATSSNNQKYSANDESIVETQNSSDSPRSSLDSLSMSALEPIERSNTTRSAATSSLRSDLFGQPQDNESNIFPSEGALFEENTREIYSDDSLSSEDESYVDDSDVTSTAFGIHRAEPGDLGLAEAIQHLTDSIDNLTSQGAVLETLLKKAELTNNVADLRILSKSKASLEREIRRKELQRQQYIVQESDSGLYGRSTIKIQSAVTDQEGGKAYALYIIEVNRAGFDGSEPTRWIVARRYSEFFQLHQHLRHKFPQVNNLDFPKKGVSMLKFQKSFIEARKSGLENYLQALLKMPEVCHSRELRSFLSSQEFHYSHSSVARYNDKYRSSSFRAQSSELVTKLYNTLQDGVEDIFGNFMVDYTGNLGTSLIPSRDQQYMKSNGKARSNMGSSSASLLSQMSKSAYDAPSIASADIRKIGKRPSSVLSKSKDDLFKYSDSSKDDPRAIAEVEAELNSYEEVASSKGGEEPFIKPICDLFLELFDLNKGNNWLRGRASVVVLQQLLGGTIERKIKEQIDGLAEEGMIMNMLNLIREKLWPNGTKRLDPPIVRTTKEQAKTKSEASFLLDTLVQDLAAKVVGSSNARHASRKVFAMLQNRILNLHVICLIVDTVVQELFPEIKESST